MREWICMGDQKSGFLDGKNEEDRLQKCFYALKLKGKDEGHGMDPKDRMYIEEVSKYLDIGVNTLQRKEWRHRNKFPLGKIGKELVSYRPMIDKWIEERLNGKH